MNRNVILVWLLIFALFLLGFYYSDRISTYINDPKLFLKTLLAAGGFLNTTFTFIGINLAITLGSLGLEIVILGWEKSSLRRLVIRPSKSAIGDFMCWLLTLVGLYDFFVFLSTLGLFYFLGSLIQSKFYLGLLGNLGGSELLVFIIIFILSDLKAYLWHLFMHRIHAFWEIHKYHHSAETFNMITTTRGHFVGKGVLTVFDALFFALVGAPPVVYVGFYLVKEIWGMWIHSDVQMKLGIVGKYILVTPQLHRVHHSKDERHFDKNFGTFLIIWDRIFGTYHPAETVKEIGVDDRDYNQRGFWHDMILGFRLFLRRLIPK